MCGVRLVDRVSSDVLHDMVGVVVKIEDMIIERRLRRYGHVMRGDINSQISEVMEVETGKKGRREEGRREREEGSTKEIVGRVRKEGFETIWLEKRGYVRSKEIAREN